jgi:uncharacterized protein YidB (DUF937 family)
MDILGGLMGKTAPKTGNPLLDSLLPMLLKGGGLGGLGGLLGKFTGAGLGDKANSWVGNGPNAALEPHEVETALGSDTIGKLAKQAGVSQDDAKGGLAAMLPNLVNSLTPSGSLPTGNIAKALKGVDFGKILGGLGK